MSRAELLALFFLGSLAFFNAIWHPFVHDDVLFILKNPHIADLEHWYDAFSSPVVSEGTNTYYRPALEILYRLEYRLFGPYPVGFHLFNIIIHIVNGLLLFSLLQKLGFLKHVAWVVALLFLIHPVQTEAVSCIAGISNLWMALGVLLALHAYLRKWYIVSLLCFVAAFLSKEQAVMFVPMVMVIDQARGEKNFRLWSWGAFATLALLWLRQNVTGASLLRDLTVSPGELYLRLAAIPRDIGMDLRLIFCPYDLHYYRSTDILQSNSLSWIFALIFISVVLYIFYRWPSARETLIFGLGWFSAALLPVLNIAPLINEYSFILTPEHFLYLPIVGILTIAVVAGDRFLRKFRTPVLGLVISACFLLTWHQNTFWKSETALFERMLQYEPNFGRGHLLLAKVYYFRGLPAKADGHFEKAFMIMTGYAKKASNRTAKNFYLMFVKEILFDWAENDSAMGNWQKALEKDKSAIIIDGEDASLYNNMAFIYVHLKDKEAAKLSLEQALRIDPSNAQASHNLQALILDSRK